MVNGAISTVLSSAEAKLQAGRWQEARAQALPFVDDHMHGLRARSVVASAVTQMGDYAEAVRQLKFLQQALPAHEGVRTALSVNLNNLGSTAWQSGSVTEAETYYREALAVDQRNSLAWFNLAVCVQKSNDFTQAAQAFERCTKLDPSRSEARIQWAICERVRGAPEQAREALAGFAEAQLDAGLLAKIGAEWDLLGEPDAAAQVYARAEGAGDAALILRIAQAQLGSGDVTAAQANGRRTLALAGGGAIGLKASLIAALGLPAVPASQAEIAHARSAFAEGIATLETDWPAERLQASGINLDDLAHSHYLLAYQGQDDTLLATAFGNWYCAAATAIAARNGGSEMMPARSHARRLALISARWNIGTIGAYFGSWVDALVDAGWDVHLYHIGSAVDDWTVSIAQRPSVFHHLPGPVEETVASLQETAPAVIIYPEVGLSPRVHALAALRLAPLQAAAWGHPVSPGLSSIDVYFSCAEMEPVDAVRHYQEQLVLLPHLGTNYRRPERATAISRSELGLPENHPVYLAPHGPVKLQSTFDDLLAGIARLDPQSRFVMFEGSAPALTARLRRRMQLCFDEQGLDLERHMIWLPHVPVERFRSVLAAGDVLLDSPGFSGGNTSLDAIAQGLPLVTLPGASMRSRQSAAMLNICGAGELVATTPQDYIDRALHVATDSAYAAKLRQRLLDAGAALFNDQRPLKTLVEWVEQLNERLK